MIRFVLIAPPLALILTWLSWSSTEPDHEPIVLVKQPPAMSQERFAAAFREGLAAPLAREVSSTEPLITNASAPLDQRLPHVEASDPHAFLRITHLEISKMKAAGLGLAPQPSSSGLVLNGDSRLMLGGNASEFPLGATVEGFE